MRTHITNSYIKLWGSAEDTYQWAHRLGVSWPCSYLSGKRFTAEFDSNGLCDLSINGKYPGNCPSDELSAICSDLLLGKIEPSHLLYDVVVGQFQGS